METIIERLSRYAVTSPARPAITFGSTSVSYLDLWTRSGEIAAALRGRAVTQGHSVLIRMDRSAELLVAIVGVMRAGASYSVQEHERLLRPSEPTSMLFNCTITTTDAGRTATYEYAYPPTMEELEQTSSQCSIIPNLNSVAYILFTSGSTGAPKPVGITHANIGHYCAALAERMEIKSPIVGGHASSLEADLGNTSIFLSWWSGGTLSLATEQQRRDPARFVAWLSDANLDLLKITPSHWIAMIPGLTRRQLSRKLPNLVLGGERLTFEAARRTIETGAVSRLWNHYGPTETTIGVAVCEVGDIDSYRARGFDSVPIGIPLGSVQFLVRDDRGQLGSRDIAGELFVGGPTVAAGYMGDPFATAAAFVSMPGHPGRVYKTGDRVRIDASGTTEFLGRTDRQIKLSGFRVNLDSIEVKLRQILGIEQLACVLHNAGDREKLHVFLVRRAAAWTSKFVRDLIAKEFDPSVLAFSVHFVGEWPLTPNGKTDRRRFERVLKGDLPCIEDDHEKPPGNESALQQLMIRVWCECLKLESCGVDDDFFELGGDSIDAIKAIGVLQARGVAVTGLQFMANRTIRQLSNAIENGHEDPTHVDADGEPTVMVSSAVRCLLENPAIVDADFWNQSVLLDIDRGLNIERLRHAVFDLAAEHPMLNVKLSRIIDEWRVEPAPLEDMLSQSSLEGLTERQIDTAIATVADTLNRKMDPAEGHCFFVHFFASGGKRDHLLLVAHHATTDAISWRIVIEGLFRRLNGPARSTTADNGLEPRKVHSWNVEGAKLRQELQGEISAYLGHIKNSLAGQPSSTLDSYGNEGDARSVWVGFSAEETGAIKVLAKDRGVHLATVCLAAFYSSYQRLDGSERTPLWIDIESHGRIRRRSMQDVSACVGWFTAIIPVALSTSESCHQSPIETVDRALEAVPLGIKEVGVEAEDLRNADLAPPALIYNFVGDFNLPPSLPFSPKYSARFPGEARGADNKRQHKLAVTGRVLNQALSIDVVFAPAIYRQSDVLRFAAMLRNTLLDWIDREPSALPLVEGRNTSGLLAYTPKELIGPRGKLQETSYRSAVLTGATGYLGIHLLRELLKRSDMTLYCIVRGSSDASANLRLQRHFEWYFPQEEWRQWSCRIVVVAGDLSRTSLGLSVQDYATLCREVDAIYHCAASVNLFAAEEKLRPINVDAVTRLLDLASRAGGIDFHHVSTLAVAGVNERSAPVPFSEASLDIGQSFRNSYEATKYAGEHLVRQYRLSGACAKIYRTGNVTADSKTKRFQRNAATNQFVQLLKAVFLCGRIPAGELSSITVSPVDIVAQGIAALSLSGDVAPGTFHVESPYEESLLGFLMALQCVNAELHVDPMAELSDLFGDVSGREGGELMIAKFWASRRSQNVIFDSAATIELLNRQGVVFDALDMAWKREFMGNLYRQGVFGDDQRLSAKG